MNAISIPPTLEQRIARRGIPTLYKGVMMRSRTEARWAALFDAIEWAWGYEPYELAGYIPDFILRLATDRYLLCEVKSSSEEFEAAQKKIDDSGYEHEALVVGHCLEDGRVIGRIREDDGLGWIWSEAEFFFCISCGRASVLAVEGSWRCRCCGAGNGNEHRGEFDVQAAFAAASNRVQWRPE